VPAAGPQWNDVQHCAGFPPTRTVRVPAQEHRMSRRRLLRFLTALALCLLSAQAPAKDVDAKKAAAGDAQRQLQLANKPWTGDFDAMLTRHLIRVYMPYSRSLYFVDKGRERGIGAELVRDFERWLNRKYARELGKRPLTVYFVAATRDRLIPDLRDGLDDVALANLRVTEERLKQIDFVAPDEKSVNVEILVTGPALPQIASFDDRAGKTVHGHQTSSYFESLAALNEWFRKGGKAPLKLVLVPDVLEDEDMLEMMNADLLQAMIVDDWKAKMQAPVLPKLAVREDIVLRPATPEGWAIRKHRPKLAAVSEAFCGEWAKGAGVIPYRQLQYLRNIKALKDPTSSADYKRFEQTVALFEKFGDRYDFDPMMLAAQGYQESTLDQSKRSGVGAIGVMQVMPAAGKELKIGDITPLEVNIHAGTKYMDQLMNRSLKDAEFREQDRTPFAFAAD
jgi:membrane-bound lytic murein transglycosylase MltF